MGINVKTVAQFAKMFAGKSTGVAAGQLNKAAARKISQVTYMKYGDQITKTVLRKDGTTITGLFKEIGGKWRPVNAVQQNARGVISTDLMGYGIKNTAVRHVGNPNTVATCFSSPFQQSVYKMSIDGGKTFVDTNRLLYDGLRLGIQV